ncbi:MAG: DUF1759 domain-containing protein, partial [Candidatus Thiodiazotropha endolucinida]|nr:DUF1759 domain-containing protein [Candidatus Thiodiazotropha taylori]MCW4263685.1 DUF1759 domain-containing protein [Candidatus Thiodiazotropha endolucinida]
MSANQSEQTEDLGARSRTRTERGAEYDVSLYEQKFKSAISTWRRQSNRTSTILSDSPDVDLIRAHRDSVQGAFDELTVVFQQLQALREDSFPEAAKFEDIELQHQDLMHRVSLRILELENKNYETASQSSHHSSSRSKSSVKSKQSNISKISDAAARQAALKTKLKYIDIESKFKAELEKIQTIKQMEIAGAEVEALREVLSDDDLDSKVHIPLPKASKTDYVKEYIEKIEVNTSEPNADVPDPMSHTVTGVPSFTLKSVPVFSTIVTTQSVLPSNTNITSLNPSAHTFVPSWSSQDSTQTTWIYKSSNPVITQHSQPVTNPKSQSQSNTANVSDNVCSTEQGLIELAKSLADQVNLSRLPPPEPNTFSGDPIQYPAWKAAFNTLIDQRKIPEGERIYYLRKYLGGSVRQVVENYFLLSTDDAYDKARSLLDERYGDPFIIANAFRSKLDTWPRINVKDPNALLKFSDFLKQCLSAMQTITSLSILNDSQEN